METIIVFIDDADCAIQRLQPLLLQPSHSATRWILVGCAPRVTRQISRFVTQRTSAGWRDAWADKVFAKLMPQLQTQARPQDIFMVHVAPPRQSLDELRSELVGRYGPLQVLDARRPKLAHSVQPTGPAARPTSNGAAGYLAAFSGVGWLMGFE